ncbi:MAG: hypothetical protein ACYCPA_03845 [Acidithiobacillus sp.]
MFLTNSVEVGWWFAFCFNGVLMVFPMIGFRSDLSYLVLLVVFWVLGYYFNRWLQSSLKPRLGRRPAGRRGASARSSDDYSKLLSICFGDKAKAERLIRFEQGRDSMLSRNAAISSAVDRLAHDKRSWR